MNNASDILTTIGTIGALVWLVLLVLQLSDLAASLLDVRGAHENGKPGRPARRRYSEYVWIIPLAILSVIVLAIGVQFAATLAALGLTGLAIAIVLVALVLVLVVGIAIVIALTRGERYSYGQLRANLTGDTGQRLTAAHVALFRSQLEEIDGRRRRIHLGFRDRAKVGWLRAELDDLADSFRVVPPTGLGAVSSVRLRTAHTYLWKGNIIRLVPAAVAVLVLLSFGIALIIGGPSTSEEASFGWFAYAPLSEMTFSPYWTLAHSEPFTGAYALLAIFPIIVSYLLAIQGAQFALAAKVVWHSVNQKQRADAVDLIEEFERSSRKGVTGLGDRVARALQILRDQQGDTTNSR